MFKGKGYGQSKGKGLGLRVANCVSQFERIQPTHKYVFVREQTGISHTPDILVLQLFSVCSSIVLRFKFEEQTENNRTTDEEIVCQLLG